MLASSLDLLRCPDAVCWNEADRRRVSTRQLFAYRLGHWAALGMAGTESTAPLPSGDELRVLRTVWRSRMHEDKTALM